MITHRFPHTKTQTLIDAETALADLLDAASEMVAVGDLEGSLFAELSQLKGQMATAVNSRPRPASLSPKGRS